MTTLPMSQTCSIPPCSKPSPYICPRCSRPYCSVPCYRAHSQCCVDAFSEDALHSLRGLNVSPAHRKSFNDMLERIRDQTDTPYPETYDYHDTTSGDDSDHVCENADLKTARHSHINLTADQSDCGEFHVLEQLLSSLDESGRDALFTVLNSAMENAYGRDTLSQQPPTKTSSPRYSKSHANQADASSKTKQTEDVAQTLEMLVEEMETLELSYHEILSRLPDFLRKDFEKRLREGSVDRLVPVWTPWWHRMEHPRNDDSEQVQPPAPLPSLPNSDQLLVPLHVPRQKASPCLRYSLVEVLTAHTLSMRLCNGEWWGDAFAARTVWQTSAVLSTDARYTSLEAVCNEVTKRIVLEENHAIAMQALRDAADVISGRSDWVARAVYECQRVLETGLRVAGSGKAEIHKRVRKIGFLVAWAMCQESEVFEQLARKVFAYVDLECGLAEEVKVAARVAGARRTPKITVLD